MERRYADMTGYEEITLLGVPALFTFERLFRDSVPEGAFLYELQNSDEMWGGPCRLAKEIPTALYGSVITTEPVQLPVEGYLDISKKDLLDTGEYYTSIQDFLKKYPPVDKDIMRFSIMKPEMYGLLYSQGDERNKANHCIGYVRGDFEANKILHTTWWPCQGDMLNTPRFKVDLQRVVEWLRKGFAPLRDLETMGQFCTFLDSAARLTGSGERAYGFRVETNNYLYALRCTPEEGAYHVYLYCYEKVNRKNALEDCHG